MLNRIQKKLKRNKAGFTMTEMLCVTIVLVLVSSCLTLGIDLCSKSLKSTKQFAEMQMLSTTLSASISDELRYAKNITTSGNTITFLSDRHGKNTTISLKNGQVILSSPIYVDNTNENGDYPLLSSSAYFGTTISNISFESSSNKTVTVKFTIKATDGTEKETTFMVKTLNA